MLLKIDNKGAVDLADNWSMGGQTRHIRQVFTNRIYFNMVT